MGENIPSYGHHVPGGQGKTTPLPGQYIPMGQAMSHMGVLGLLVDGMDCFPGSHTHPPVDAETCEKGLQKAWDELPSTHPYPSEHGMGSTVAFAGQ